MLIRILTRFALIAALVLGSVCLPVRVEAQELRSHKHPFSAYIDLRPAAPDAPAQTTPSWIEAVEFIPAEEFPSTAEAVEDRIVSASANGKSTFRIRIIRPEGITAEHLQARVFFEDSAALESPTVSVWNELGERLLTPVRLGQNLGLPSSETLTLPMSSSDYLEIESQSDGSQIRGVFLSWLESTEVLQPSDFRSRETVRQPFRIQSAARRQKNDSYLYGVVIASLTTGSPLVLKPAGPTVKPVEFQLERQPLVAVVTCEVLGAGIDAPPTVAVNGQPAGVLSFFLPDLSDPGFQGQAREAQTRLGFRYTGWLPAQILVPGERLAAGLNNLTLGLSNATDAVAIRSVSIQLKYNWEKLDYVLAPATP